MVKLLLFNDDKQSRARTKTAIENAISKEKRKEQYIKDMINEYMNNYDILKRINFQIGKFQEVDDKAIELLKQKRQIAKEMRTIMLFLGINPITFKEENKGYGSNEVNKL